MKGNLTNILQTVSNDGKTMLAANFYNYETLSGIMQAAEEKQCDIILQASESTIRYLGVDLTASLAKTESRKYSVNSWLHLDHGGSIEMVKKCLEAGFDSVMIDGSDKPLEENINITGEAVRLAHNFGANVEAELGYIAKLGQSQHKGMYTQAEEAAYFVDSTGVNALAVAVGTAHGFYEEEPELQIDLIKKIHNLVPAALVLHGASGVPSDQLRAACLAGIAKVNVATDSKNVFMKTLKKTLAQTEEIDLRIVFPKAIAAVKSMIIDKLNIIHGEFEV
ncbi:MAG: class II fructose-bisphosphate aldolase [Saprospiraceae bacterium]|nr:class II fructose-bisphosphate aldolase [Saprospiraceae bacterium]